MELVENGSGDGLAEMGKDLQDLRRNLADWKKSLVENTIKFNKGGM